MRDTRESAIRTAVTSLDTASETTTSTDRAKLPIPTAHSPSSPSSSPPMEPTPVTWLKSGDTTFRTGRLSRMSQ